MANVPFGEFEALARRLATTKTGNAKWEALSAALKSHHDTLIQLGTTIAGSNVNDSGISANSTFLLEYIFSVSSDPSLLCYSVYLLWLQMSCLPHTCKSSWLQQISMILRIAMIPEQDSLERAKGVFAFCHQELSAMLHITVSYAMELDQTLGFIVPLQHAVTLLAPRPTCLTAADSALLQMCVHARMYRHAVNFLTSRPVLEIDPPVCSLTAEQYLTYHYYAALCFIAVKNYSMAIEHLTNCITIPGSIVSSISLQAARTARLVSLIHAGSPFKLPTCTSMVVRESFLANNLTLAYRDIESAFLGTHKTSMTTSFPGDPNVPTPPSTAPAFEACHTLSNIIDINKDILVADGNFGLAQCLHQAQKQFFLQKLTKTFLTLSLSAIASQLNLSSIQEAEALLCGLVSQERLHASIHQQSGVVQFSDGALTTSTTDDALVYHDLKLEQTLIANIKATMALQQQVESLRGQVYMSPQYLKTITSSTTSMTSAGAVNTPSVAGSQYLGSTGRTFFDMDTGGDEMEGL